MKESCDLPLGTFLLVIAIIMIVAFLILKGYPNRGFNIGEAENVVKLNVQMKVIVMNV